MSGQKVPDSSGVRTLAARARYATDCVCFNLVFMCFRWGSLEALSLFLNLYERNMYLRDYCIFGFVVLDLSPNV